MDFKERFEEIYVRPEDLVKREIVRRWHDVLTNFNMYLYYRQSKFLDAVKSNLLTLIHQIAPHLISLDEEMRNILKNIEERIEKGDERNIREIIDEIGIVLYNFGVIRFEIERGKAMAPIRKLKEKYGKRV